eukprot:1161071-Pelagomonas_calceolata.AAC.4
MFYLAMHEKYKKSYAGSGNSPYINERDTLAQKSLKSPPLPKQEKDGLVGIWRVASSTRIQNLAVRIIFAFNSTPSDYKFVSVFYRMCMHQVHV